MTQYDGDVKLGVELDPKDIKQSAHELEQAIREVFDTTAGKQTDKGFKQLEMSMSKAVQRAHDLSSQLADLENKKIPTEEYQILSRSIEKTKIELDKLIEKQIEMVAQGKAGTPAFESLDRKITEMGTSLRVDQGELQELVEQGKAFTLGSDTQEYEKKSQALADTNNQMRLLLERTKEYEISGNNVAKTEQKRNESTKELTKNVERLASPKISNGVKKLNNSFDTMGNTLKKSNAQMKKFVWTLLKYGLGIRSLYVLFRKLRSAVKEGIKNIAQFNDGNNETNVAISGLISSLNYLKNSFGAAFAPIVNVIAPILSNFIDQIAETTNKIGMLIAALMSQSTFIKAKKVQTDYAKSLDKTADSIDKVNNKLGAYDKLQVIAQDTAKDEKENPVQDMFEEVPVDSTLLDKFKSIFDKVKQYLEPVKEYLGTLWEDFKQGFDDAIGDVNPRIETIKQGLASIKQSVIDIFSDPEVRRSVDDYVHSTAYLLGSLAGATASIGLTIGANLIGGISQYLAENKDRIKTYIVQMFDIRTEINELVAEYAQKFADVFSVFGEENGVHVTSDIIGIFADAFMYIQLLVARIARDTLQLFLQPFIDNADKIRLALDGLLGFFGTILDNLKSLVDYIGENVLKLYDEHIKPFIDDVTSGISEIQGSLLDGWNTYIQPVLDEVGPLITEMTEKYIKPVLDEIFGLIGDVIDILRLLWNNVLQPLLNWIAQNIMPVIAPVISGISKVVIGAIEIILTWIQTLLKSLRAIITFLVKVFSGDWKGAWEGLKKDFTSIWSNLVDKIKGPINLILAGFETMANGAISALNGIIRAFNNFRINVPDWMTWAIEELAGVHVESIGFSIPQVSQVRIPRLAQGAVIPPNKEFLAVLGDQGSGTNIETPLQTMVDAFKTALQEQGTTHNEPIVLQLDGKVIAKAVWNETDKRYKQLGKYVPSYT